MHLLIRIIGIAFLVGILGTGLGGAVTLLFGNPSRRTLSMLLGFSGGVMVSLSAFDLMPEAFELGGTTIGLAGLLAGTLLTTAIDMFIPDLHETGHMHNLAHGGRRGGPGHRHRFKQAELDPESEKGRFLRTGYVVAIGIALHNLPEGLAVGAGLKADPSFGLAVSLLIMLHNMPEGMAVAGPLLASGRSKRDVLLLSAAAGAPTILGAAIGGIVGAVSPLFLAFAFAFAAGAMVFISFDELIPSAQRLARGHSGTFGAVLGMLVAIIISQVLH